MALEDTSKEVCTSLIPVSKWPLVGHYLPVDPFLPGEGDVAGWGWGWEATAFPELRVFVIGVPLQTSYCFWTSLNEE